MPLSLNSIRLVALAGVTALTALAAGPVAAQDAGKLYAGIGLGLTDFTSDHEGIGYSDTPVGWQLYGGFQVSDPTAVEIAVERAAGIDSGELRGSGIERLRISAEHTSFTARGVFNLSLEEVLRGRQKITVFGSLGVARLHEERSVSELTTSRSTSASERDTALVIGGGVTFEIARVRLRTYFQSIDRAGGDLSSLGAAAEFRF